MASTNRNVLICEEISNALNEPFAGMTIFQFSVMSNYVGQREQFLGIKNCRSQIQI
jgi:hypothetical protein